MANACFLSCDELLRYSREEREKWRAWFLAHPEAIDVGVQPGGRFETVGQVINHIFLGERQHLQRLTGAPVDRDTGLSGRHAPPLFDYGASVRRELEQYVAELDPDAADECRAIQLSDGSTQVVSARKLLFHVLLHEARHWAQIALAVRQAVLAPPGRHDLLYSSAFK
ncbi:MAG TPA: DinB family protein [Vicinamibacterales bacterium]|nr:DinB family protein [Vicinamibacterales bacterium]